MSNLEYCIKASKLTEDYICENAGVTKANLTKYKAETAVPNVKTAISLAKVLGLKVEDIWG